jgi:hypothetical protein
MELQEATTPPPSICVSLPKDDTKAYTVLFFLYMPSELSALARLSVMSQQMLLPDVTLAGQNFGEGQI